MPATYDYDLVAIGYPTLSDVYKYAAYDGLGNLARHREARGEPSRPGR